MIKVNLEAQKNSG